MHVEATTEIGKDKGYELKYLDSNPSSISNSVYNLTNLSGSFSSKVRGRM